MQPVTTTTTTTNNNNSHKRRHEVFKCDSFATHASRFHFGKASDQSDGNRFVFIFVDGDRDKFGIKIRCGAGHIAPFPSAGEPVTSAQDTVASTKIQVPVRFTDDNVRDQLGVLGQHAIAVANDRPDFFGTKKYSALKIAQMFTPLMKEPSDVKYAAVCNLRADENTVICDRNKKVYPLSVLKKGLAFTRMIFKVTGLQIRPNSSSWGYSGKIIELIEIDINTDKPEFEPLTFDEDEEETNTVAATAASDSQPRKKQKISDDN